MMQSKLHGEVVIATSTLARDDAIEALCKEEGIPCFRGDELDLLDRYYRCADEYDAEVIVRVTADCPLLSPVLFDQTIEAHLAAGADYTLMQQLYSQLGKSIHHLTLEEIIQLVETNLEWRILAQEER